MKIVFLISFFLISPAFAQFNKSDLNRVEELFKTNEKDKLELITYYLINNNYYFSAVLFAKQYLAENKEISPLFERALQKIMLKAGTETFSDLNFEILKKHDVPALKLALGIKYFKNNQFLESVAELKKVPEEHRFYPESQFIRGSALQLSKQYPQALEQYDQCIESANKFISKFKQEKLKRYYSLMAENCIIHKARILYRQQNFTESVHSYEKISKNSYLWPYILLEKAWSYYQLKDYNRTLGLNVTYKSPLMDSYFFPEAEVLNALSYYRLCLYQDALKVIEQYYEVYKPRSEELRKLVDANKNSEDYFIRAIFEKRNDKTNSFLTKLSTQIKKKVKFNLDLLSYKKAEEELKRIEKMQETSFVKLLKSELKDSIKMRTKKLNHFVHKYFVDFINSVYIYSHNMFDIKLDIMSNQRSLIYRNTGLVSDRARGDLTHVSRTSKQHFYTFKGAFWADELGDYSFGLKSNCEEVKIVKTKEEREKEDSEQGQEEEVEIQVDNPITSPTKP